MLPNLLSAPLGISCVGAETAPPLYVAIWRMGNTYRVFGPADRHTAARAVSNAGSDILPASDQPRNPGQHDPAPQTPLNTRHRHDAGHGADQDLVLAPLEPLPGPPLGAGQPVYYYTHRGAQQHFTQAIVEKVTRQHVRIVLGGSTAARRTVACQHVYPFLSLVETDARWDGQPFLIHPERHRVIAGADVRWPLPGPGGPRRVYAILTWAPDQVATLLDHLPTLIRRSVSPLPATEAALPGPARAA